MLKFAYPEYFWFFAALPVLVLWFVIAHRQGKKRLALLVSRELWSDVVSGVSVAKRVIRHTLFLSAGALLILAAARPQIGTRLEEVKREGIDIFVALDVSLSMKSEDIRPSRLDKAKRDVSVLLKKLAGDRVGLIVFAGEAFVQFPLTADYSAADLFISAVDVDAVPTPGTQIARAIELALTSFPQDLPTQKAIIVVSDGENTEGDVMRAIQKAKEANVRVYAVGMGTLEGGPIPIYDGRGTRVDYKRDRGGSIVLTRLDESTLLQIAAVSGGSYRRATSGGNEIDEIFSELAALEKTELGTMQVTGFEDQYQYPLALALLLLMLEILIGERRGHMANIMRRILPYRVAAMIALIVTPVLASAQTIRGHVSDGNEAYAKGEFTNAEVAYRKALEKDPASTVPQFNLGNTAYKQNKWDEAVRSYSHSAAKLTEEERQAQALHNLGNALLKSGKIPESIEAYKRALRLNPADDETRYNLQYAREMMNNQQQQQQNKQQSDQQQQNKDQQQQHNQQDQQQQNEQQQNQQRQPEQAKQDQVKQRQAQEKNQMQKQEAERILQALKDNEREIQKQLRKKEGVRVKVERDW